MCAQRQFSHLITDFRTAFLLIPFLLGIGCGSTKPVPYNSDFSASTGVNLPKMELAIEGEGAAVSKSAGHEHGEEMSRGSGMTLRITGENLEPLQNGVYVVWGIDTDEEAAKNLFRLGTLDVHHNSGSLKIGENHSSLGGIGWDAIDSVAISIEEDPEGDGVVAVETPSESMPLYSSDLSAAGGVAALSVSATTDKRGHFGNGYHSPHISKIMKPKHGHEEGEHAEEEEEHGHHEEGEHAEEEEEHGHEEGEHAEEEEEHGHEEGEHAEEEEEHGHEEGEHAEEEEEHGHHEEGEHAEEEEEHGHEDEDMDMGAGKSVAKGGGDDHGAEETGDAVEESGGLSFKNAGGTFVIHYVRGEIEASLSGFPEAPIGYHYEIWATTMNGTQKRLGVLSMRGGKSAEGSAFNIASAGIEPIAIQRIQISLEADKGYENLISPSVVLEKTLVDNGQQEKEEQGHGGHVH